MSERHEPTELERAEMREAARVVDDELGNLIASYVAGLRARRRWSMPALEAALVGTMFRQALLLAKALKVPVDPLRAYFERFAGEHPELDQKDSGRSS